MFINFPPLSTGYMYMKAPNEPEFSKPRIYGNSFFFSPISFLSKVWRIAMFILLRTYFRQSYKNYRKKQIFIHSKIIANIRLNSSLHTR